MDFSTALYLDFVYCCHLNLRRILLKQPQRCQRSVPVLVHVHVHPYCAKAHFFQPYQDRLSVLWARYGALTLVKQTGLQGSNVLGLPSVRAS